MMLKLAILLPVVSEAVVSKKTIQGLPSGCVAESDSDLKRHIETYAGWDDAWGGTDMEMKNCLQKSDKKKYCTKRTQKNIVQTICGLHYLQSFPGPKGEIFTKQLSKKPAYDNRYQYTDYYGQSLFSIPKKTTLYRGFRDHKDQMKMILKNGLKTGTNDVFHEESFMSTTTDNKLDFLVTSNYPYIVQFNEIPNDHQGVFIMGISSFGLKEKEVLFPPDTSFKITAVYKKGTKLTGDLAMRWKSSFPDGIVSREALLIATMLPPKRAYPDLIRKFAEKYKLPISPVARKVSEAEKAKSKEGKSKEGKSKEGKPGDKPSKTKTGLLSNQKGGNNTNNTNNTTSSAIVVYGNGFLVLIFGVFGNLLF